MRARRASSVRLWRSMDFGAMRDLGVQLFRVIVASLGVADVERFVPKEPALARLNHYPPCPDPARTTGLVPHHDANLITILHQGGVGGLQVLKDGRWVAVRPHPNAFAINAGNMLQVISNELCSSALHRAMVNKEEDRYSLAYFVQAPDWEHMAPLAELIDGNHPAKYRPFTWRQYLASQWNTTPMALTISYYRPDLILHALGDNRYAVVYLAILVSRN